MMYVLIGTLTLILSLFASAVADLDEDARPGGWRDALTTLGLFGSPALIAWGLFA